MITEFLAPYVNLLRKRKSFSYVIFAQLCSDLGDWFSFIASASIILLIDNSSYNIMLLMLVRFLPPALLTPVAGLISDRRNPWTIIFWCDIGRGLLVSIFFTAYVWGEVSVALVVLVNGLQFCLTALHRPAWMVIIPSIVAKAELAEANIVSSAVWSIMLTLGVALGGITMALFGATVALAVDSLSYFVSAAFIRSAQARSHSSLRGRHAKHRPIEDMIIAARYLKRRPILHAITYLKAVSALTNGSFLVLQTRFVEYYAGSKGVPLTMGLIYFFAGLGTLAAPMAVRIFIRRNMGTAGLVMTAAFVCGTLALIIMSLGNNLPLHFLATFMTKAEASVVWITSSFLLQSMTARSVLGRVIAYESFSMIFATAASAVALGFVLETLGWSAQRTALALALIQGSGIVFCLLLVWRFQIHAERGATRTLRRFPWTP